MVQKIRMNIYLQMESFHQSQDSHTLRKLLNVSQKYIYETEQQRNVSEIYFLFLLLYKWILRYVFMWESCSLIWLVEVFMKKMNLHHFITKWLWNKWIFMGIYNCIPTWLVLHVWNEFCVSDLCELTAWTEFLTVFW